MDTEEKVPDLSPELFAEQSAHLEADLGHFREDDDGEDD